MKLFTNGERHALLDTCAGYSRDFAVPGWHGYTLVTFWRAPTDDAWSVAARERLGPRVDALARAAAAAHKLARALSLDVAPGRAADALNHSPNLDWHAAQAWVVDAAGRAAVLATVLPDVVWGTHFPDVCGPLVAIVFWPPGANNDHSRCVVKAACLGADAWTHLDAAAAWFRERVCADAGDDIVTVRTTLSVSPLCSRGATMYLERVSLPRADETWSAEVIRGRDADDALTRAIFALK